MPDFIFFLKNVLLRFCYGGLDGGRQIYLRIFFSLFSKTIVCFYLFFFSFLIRFFCVFRKELNQRSMNVHMEYSLSDPFH